MIGVGNHAEAARTFWRSSRPSQGGFDTDRDMEDVRFLHEVLHGPRWLRSARPGTTPSRPSSRRRAASRVPRIKTRYKRGERGRAGSGLVDDPMDLAMEGAVPRMNPLHDIPLRRSFWTGTQGLGDRARDAGRGAAELGATSPRTASAASCLRCFGIRWWRLRVTAMPRPCDGAPAKGWKVRPGDAWTPGGVRFTGANHSLRNAAHGWLKTRNFGLGYHQSQPAARRARRARRQSTSLFDISPHRQRR